MSQNKLPAAEARRGRRIIARSLILIVLLGFAGLLYENISDKQPISAMTRVPMAK